MTEGALSTTEGALSTTEGTISMMENTISTMEIAVHTPPYFTMRRGWSPCAPISFSPLG
jgi:hypothetical protein